MDKVTDKRNQLLTHISHPECYGFEIGPGAMVALPDCVRHDAGGSLIQHPL